MFIHSKAFDKSGNLRIFCLESHKRDSPDKGYDLYTR